MSAMALKAVVVAQVALLCSFSTPPSVQGLRMKSGGEPAEMPSDPAQVAELAFRCFMPESKLKLDFADAFTPSMMNEVSVERFRAHFPQCPKRVFLVGPRRMYSCPRERLETVWVVFVTVVDFLLGLGLIAEAEMHVVKAAVHSVFKKAAQGKKEEITFNLPSEVIRLYRLYKFEDISSRSISEQDKEYLQLIKEVAHTPSVAALSSLFAALD